MIEALHVVINYFIVNKHAFLFFDCKIQELFTKNIVKIS